MSSSTQCGVEGSPTAWRLGRTARVWFNHRFRRGQAVSATARSRRCQRADESRTVGIAVTADGAAWLPIRRRAKFSSMRRPVHYRPLRWKRRVARLGKIAAAPDGSVGLRKLRVQHYARQGRQVAASRDDSVRGGPRAWRLHGWTRMGDVQSANQLLRIAADGPIAHRIPTRSSSPADIAVGGDGVVWCLEFRCNKMAIRRWPVRGVSRVRAKRRPYWTCSGAR